MRISFAFKSLLVKKKCLSLYMFFSPNEQVLVQSLLARILIRYFCLSPILLSRCLVTMLLIQVVYDFMSLAIGGEAHVIIYYGSQTGKSEDSKKKNEPKPKPAVIA